MTRLALHNQAYFAHGTLSRIGTQLENDAGQLSTSSSIDRLGYEVIRG